MRELDRKRFIEDMVRLRNCYGAFFGGAEEWGMRLNAYFDQLAKHDLRDVEIALEQAPGSDHFPDRFPTAGQLQRLVITAELERKQSRADAARQQMRRTDDERILEEFAMVPFGRAAQDEYIAEAPNAFERLGRTWQCESKNAGLDPLRSSPRDVQVRRMQEFWKLWTENEPQTRVHPDYQRGAMRAKASRNNEDKSNVG